MKAAYANQQLATSQTSYYLLRVKQHHDASQADGEPKQPYYWMSWLEPPSETAERGLARRFSSLWEVMGFVGQIADRRCLGYETKIALEDLELIFVWQNEAPVDLHEALGGAIR